MSLDGEMGVPSTADGFRSILEGGETPDGLARALVRAFQSAIKEFMDSVPRGDVSADLQWQMIALSVFMDNMVGAIDADTVDVPIADIAGRMEEVLGPLAEALRASQIADPEIVDPDPDEGGEHGSTP